MNHRIQLFLQFFSALDHHHLIFLETIRASLIMFFISVLLAQRKRDLPRSMRMVSHSHTALYNPYLSNLWSSLGHHQQSIGKIYLPCCKTRYYTHFFFPVLSFQKKNASKTKQVSLRNSVKSTKKKIAKSISILMYAQITSHQRKPMMCS